MSNGRFASNRGNACGRRADRAAPGSGLASCTLKPRPIAEAPVVRDARPDTEPEVSPCNVQAPAVPPRSASICEPGSSPQRADGAMAVEALDGPRHAMSPIKQCRQRQAGQGLGNAGGCATSLGIGGTYTKVPGEIGKRCAEEFHRTPKEIGRPGRFQMAARRRAEPLPSLPQAITPPGTSDAKRLTNNSTSPTRDRRREIQPALRATRLASRTAVPAASVSPSAPWPALTNTLVSRTRRTIGKESGVAGRRPVHTSGALRSHRPG